MPHYWTCTTSNSKVDTWNFSSDWIPDAVIVKLGDNDYASWKKP